MLKEGSLLINEWHYKPHKQKNQDNNKHYKIEICKSHFDALFDMFITSFGM